MTADTDMHIYIWPHDLIPHDRQGLCTGDALSAAVSVGIRSFIARRIVDEARGSG